MGLKFTKVVPSETPSPTPPKEAPKGEGIPKLNTNVTPSTPEKGEGVKDTKPRGIPTEVAPSLPSLDKPSAKSSTQESNTEDETTIEKPKRKRGRPPGGSNSTRGKKSSYSVDKMAAQIEGYHAMGDVFIPGLAITNGQARILAEGIIGVMDAYDFQPDPRIASIIALAGAVGMVEMPKVVLVKKHLDRMKAIEAARKQSKAPVNLVPKVTPPQPRPETNSIFAHQSQGVAKGEAQNES